MKKTLQQKNKACPQCLKHSFCRRGFTLVETLVAISIFTMSILALLSVLSQGISNTHYAKTKMTGLYLAQEGIEYIRNMRDTFVLYSERTGNDWTKFRAKLASCNLGNECGIDNGALSTDPSFIFKCSSGASGCKLYLNNGNYNATTGNESGFVRKIWAEVIDPDKEIKIFSSVSWNQGSGAYNITLSENLFNWVE